MPHSRRKGPGRDKDIFHTPSKAGTKITEKCNLGLCTLRNYSMYGQDLMSRFYNNRFSKGGFSIKVM